VLFLGILAFAATLSSIAQEPSVRFIDADGKTIAEVPAQHREEQVYLSVDAVKQVIDPAATHQYNHPRKRLTLKTKGRQIRLQMGKPTVSIDPGGQTLTLSTPPIIIAQQPMLPIAFFTQLLPILNDVDVIYDSNLNRLQIRPKRDWTPVETDDTQNWAIIVDPGHGGDNQGCEGSTGILEKNIVLVLAKQLQRMSKQQGIQVYLTRETDTKRTHFERIQVAKQKRGQLFLSLHCNASFSPHEKGIRIYLNNPKGQIRFPSTTKPALTGQRVKILTQVNFLKQSHDFARALQTELNFLTETPVQIIDLPLIALSEAYMPAVVLELGYLSNVKDLEKLSNAEYTESVSQAMTRALQRYISSVNQQIPATAIE
jgi:N-acetylmuramoyl-L-alanine amidase